MGLLWKKIGCLIAAVVLLSGCTGVHTEKPTENVADIVSLDWYINFSWFQTEWGASDVSRAITERTGVDVNFISPMGSEGEKLDALIAQGNLPDIVTLGWWEPQVRELMDSRYVYPLNELAQQYAPEFFEVAGEGQMRWYTQADGNLYCYPNCSVSPQDYNDGVAQASNHSFLVRKDIYEALGCPDMTTPEGFSNAIRRAVEMFPEENGYQLIPFGAHEFNKYGCDSFDSILMNFLAIPYEEDGRVYDRTADPEYIAWLKVFRRLFQEGYLTEDIFIKKRAQMEEELNRGQYFCLLYQYSDIVKEQLHLLNTDPNKVYIAVEGPKNSLQQPHRLPSVGINGWTVTFISKNCKDPEKAIKFISFLMTEEGQKLTYLGVEGEHYTWQNGVACMTPETEKLYYEDYITYVDTIGADNTYWMLENTAMQSQWPINIAPELKQPEQWSEQYSFYSAPYEITCELNSPEWEIEDNVKALWGEVLPLLLMADSDQEFDRLFEEYLTQRSAMGYETLLDTQTEVLNRNKERLNIQ